MTCFPAPDGRALFCSTYYPREAFLQCKEEV